jgi:hypothetical protein
MHVKECSLTVRKGRAVTGVYELQRHGAAFYTRNGIRIAKGSKLAIAVRK